MSDKPHVSPTQLDMHAKCGMQYHFRYVEGIIIPPGTAMMKGTSVHGAAKVNNRQKIESHKDLPIAELKEAAAAAFEGAQSGGYRLDDEERDRGEKVVMGEAKDRAVAMTEVYGKEIAPAYQPGFVEKRFRILLPGPRDLVGIIDMADIRRNVVDLKTTAKKKSQADADASLQLTTYAAGHKAITGHDAASLKLETVVQTKTKTYRQTLQTSRTAASQQVLANRINAMTESLAAGVIVPAPPSAWWCSRKWCGYHSMCPFVENGRNRNGD